jgi:nitrile hydratase
MGALAPGDRVTVRDDYPNGHFRTPVYVRGKRGVVASRHGAFANPELLAYRLDGPQRALFKVRFRQADLWPDYRGGADDTVELDLYEHWLQPA